MSNPDNFVNKNTMLVREFDRYILEHPEFAEKIPDNALVVMQIADDEEFNQWARRTGQSVAAKDNPIRRVFTPIVANLLDSLVAGPPALSIMR